MKRWWRGKEEEDEAVEASKGRRGEETVRLRELDACDDGGS